MVLKSWGTYKQSQNTHIGRKVDKMYILYSWNYGLTLSMYVILYS